METNIGTCQWAYDNIIECNDNLIECNDNLIECNDNQQN